MYYANSISALQQLLFSGPPPNAEEGDGSKKNVHCHITKKSENISHVINGIQYCSVEVTCDDGSQYGIQAYGDEAIDLYKEIYKCCMCGMPPKELKKSTLVEERIDGTTHTFDKNECALIFKKLRSVMGEEEECRLETISPRILFNSTKRKCIHTIFMTKRNSIFVLAGLIGALLLLSNLLIAELLPTIINNLSLILTIPNISQPAVAQVSLKEDSSVEIIILN